MPAAKPIECPICGKPAAAETTPFCCSRHRDRDLLQWLGEGYRIPGRPIGTDGLDTGEDPD
ncbi:DNA gyrase inhibitor YacG [Sphingomonas sp. R86521]|uniref:DNA gyrase inhibitor YacG n=1 Tax=Sphingomonas sp. R86521 TaxID=3093860 RepID=UPI0036D3BC23